MRNKLKRFPFRLIALLVCLPTTSTQAARPVASQSDTSVIEAHDFNNVSGVISVNEAAGNANQQINTRAIAVHSRGTAVAGNTILQTPHIDGLGVGAAQGVTYIGEQAFASASGIIGINQVGGGGNAQSNGVAIAVGIKGQTVTDNALADSSPVVAGLVKTERSHAARRDLTVADTAFLGTHGIVQLNQTGGVGNNSSNNFALNLSAAPKL